MSVLKKGLFSRKTGKMMEIQRALQNSDQTLLYTYRKSSSMKTYKDSKLYAALLCLSEMQVSCVIHHLKWGNDLIQNELALESALETYSFSISIPPEQRKLNQARIWPKKYNKYKYFVAIWAGGGDIFHISIII